MPPQRVMLAVHWARAVMCDGKPRLNAPDVVGGDVSLCCLFVGP